MAKQKRARIAAVQTFPNVTHNGAELRRQWRSIFNNENPITLELGCGKGDYTLALAQKNPTGNYIGVDLKSARLWAASTFALQQDIKNVHFIRGNVLDLTTAFDAQTISEVWITFPDPYPKKPRKRMTAERYLDVYVKICHPAAHLHLKTDDDAFYEFSLESITRYGGTIHQNITDIHSRKDINEQLKIITYYEGRHIAAGCTIKYIEFTLPQKDKV